MSDQELIFKNEKDFQPVFKKLIRKVKRLQFENSQPIDYHEVRHRPTSAHKYREN